VSQATSFNQDAADKICERIALGESVRKISKDKGMPCESTIYKWLRDVDGFSQQYARAREDQAEFYLDEIIAISDDVTLDTVVDGEGNERTNNEAIQRSRLKVDTRKWVMGKLKPKKYGDKIQQEITINESLSNALDEARKRAGIDT